MYIVHLYTQYLEMTPTSFFSLQKGHIANISVRALLLKLKNSENIHPHCDGSIIAAGQLLELAIIRHMLIISAIFSHPDSQIIVA